MIQIVEIRTTSKSYLFGPTDGDRPQQLTRLHLVLQDGMGITRSGQQMALVSNSPIEVSITRQTSFVVHELGCLSEGINALSMNGGVFLRVSTHQLRNLYHTFAKPYPPTHSEGKHWLEEYGI